MLVFRYYKVTIFNARKELNHAHVQVVVISILVTAVVCVELHTCR